MTPNESNSRARGLTVALVATIAGAFLLAAVPAHAQRASVNSLAADHDTLLQILTPKLGFVTSMTFNGNLGGLTGADAKCQAAADAAGLGGVFRAWLIDTNTSIFERWETLALAPYYRLDGQRIARDHVALASVVHEVAISIDEFGATVPFAPAGGSVGVWTGGINGVPGGRAEFAAETCNGWLSSISGGGIGLENQIDQSWIDAANRSCGLASHLYCFEQ